MSSFILLPILALLAVAGCAAQREQARFAALVDGTHVGELRRAASAAELDNYLAAALALGPRLEDRDCAYQRARQPGGGGAEFFCELGGETLCKLAPSGTIRVASGPGLQDSDTYAVLGSRLLLLRHGRLHLVELQAGGRPELRLADTVVLAAAPLPTGEATWYQQVLAFEDRGREYALLLAEDMHGEHSELRLFELAASGRLRPVARYGVRHQLYGGQGYRLYRRGDQLLLPLTIPLMSPADLPPAWPALARLDGAATPQWQVLAGATDVRLPLAPAVRPSIHLLLRCPLAGFVADRPTCHADGVVGSHWKSLLQADAGTALLALTERDRMAWLQPNVAGIPQWDWDSALDGLPRDAYTALYRFDLDRASTTGPTVTRLEGALPGADALQLEGEQAHAVTLATPPAGCDKVEGTAVQLLLQPRTASDFGSRLPPARAPLTRLVLPDEPRRLRFAAGALWSETRQGPGLPVQLLRQPLAGGPAQRFDLPHGIGLIEPAGPWLLAAGWAGEGMAVSALAAGPDRAALLGTATVRSHAGLFNGFQAYAAFPVGAGWIAALPGYPRQEPAADESGQQSVVADLLLFQLDDQGIRHFGTIDMQQPPSACGDYCDDGARLMFLGERILAFSGALLKEARIEHGKLLAVRSLSLEPAR